MIAHGSLPHGSLPLMRHLHEVLVLGKPLDMPFQHFFQELSP
jgi:hypothetical protein